MLLKFTDTAQSYPETRDPETRKLDFNEIYLPFLVQRATEQASRCSQCGIPFCQVHCPLGNNIPDWLKLTSDGRLKEAYEVAKSTNNFPEICGRICPQDKLCEGNCVIEKGFGSVTIGSVEKYITETAFEEGWVKPFTPKKEIKKSIGIIGAGPAGLAAAEMLRTAGYQVHIYDRYDRPGGLMMYGIPNFKLAKDVVLRRRDLFIKSGVQFHYNMEIGKTISFQKLRKSHHAILIATGVYKAKDLRIPGSNFPNVIPALSYLIANNKQGLGDKVPEFESGKLNAKGKHVVVIGGGDTAMDCVRTAVRQNAASVRCLYRRDRKNMPGSKREVKHAEEEGVIFDWLSFPKKYEGDAKAEAILVGKNRIAAHKKNGRMAFESIEGEEHSLAADMIIHALGFDPEELPILFREPELSVSNAGTIHINAEMQTNLRGVFAAGDIVRGASLVVWAIRDGRDAANHMQRYMEKLRA